VSQKLAEFTNTKAEYLTNIATVLNTYGTRHLCTTLTRSIHVFIATLAAPRIPAISSQDTAGLQNSDWTFQITSTPLYTPHHSFIFLPWFSWCSFLTYLLCITFPRPLTPENTYFVLLPEPQGKTVWQGGEDRSMQLSLRAMQNWVGGHTPSPTWKTLMHPPQPAEVGATFIDSSMTRTRYCRTKKWKLKESLKSEWMATVEAKLQLSVIACLSAAAK